MLFHVGNTSPTPKSSVKGAGAADGREEGSAPGTHRRKNKGLAWRTVLQPAGFYNSYNRIHTVQIIVTE